MMSISWKSFLPLYFFLTITACFGGRVDVGGSIQKYRNGTVYTEGGSFRVGQLPPTWDRKKLDYRVVLFVHKSLRASIGISSFCKEAADDAPLTVLSSQIRHGLTGQKMMRRESVLMGGREALRMVTEGKMDGAEIILDTVVLKMNECVFDFSYTAIPSDYHAGRADFESFFGGFRW